MHLAATNFVHNSWYDEVELVHGLTECNRSGEDVQKGVIMVESTTRIEAVTQFHSHQELLTEFLRRLPRQAPGSEAETQKVLTALALSPTEPLTMVAHHCGTGNVALELATRFAGTIIAVDPRAELLDELLQVSEAMSLRATIQATSDDVVELPIVKESLDLVWSQYPNNDSTFERVIQYWHGYLKQSGFVVLTELIWLNETAPDELTTYLKSANKIIATLEERLDQLAAQGFDVLYGELLPEACHTHNYYQPMSDLFESFMDEYNTPAAVGVVAELKHEIANYKKYKEDFGYAVFIARKL